jgi:hypothetical protein
LSLTHDDPVVLRLAVNKTFLNQPGIRIPAFSGMTPLRPSLDKKFFEIPKN